MTFFIFIFVMEIHEEYISEQRIESIKCGKEGLLAIKDTMILLSGKWKIQIIGCLMIYGTMRFLDLRRRVDGIAAKMLSKELKELELNELIQRKVMQTKPITVEYELTPHGESLVNVIRELRSWGTLHRQYVFRK
ncbi:winged helix-turn-helix transcriptional regulator [Xanthocytophaga flava]|uniref:winged helix-turn-helix transcriptional regulator n=1 Tax=Xanthocytophaga flava TaxID=3048013 RepID=UPI0028D31D6B|nr:helix-turn-helix domain-containing protein [Xanthocytophaga flavus]MDJ1467298.1 helix-turn-helix domain-containing protein [Xanthocytophaga flavus]